MRPDMQIFQIKIELAKFFEGKAEGGICLSEKPHNYFCA